MKIFLFCAVLLLIFFAEDYYLQNRKGVNARCDSCGKRTFFIKENNGGYTCSVCGKTVFPQYGRGETAALCSLLLVSTMLCLVFSAGHREKLYLILLCYFAAFEAALMLSGFVLLPRRIERAQEKEKK